jgi:hypothetical protein
MKAMKAKEPANMNAEFTALSLDLKSLKLTSFLTTGHRGGKLM